MSKRTLYYLMIIAGLLALLFSTLHYFSRSKNTAHDLNTSARQTRKEGRMQIITHLMDTVADYHSGDTMNICYRDSTIIENICAAVTDLDLKGATVISHPTLYCRYLDFRENAVYYYNSFSDTALLLKKSSLSDSCFRNGDWPMNVEVPLAITGEPESITDTTMEGVHFKRFRFTLAHHNPKTEYSIGYFNCDEGFTMLSMEKTFSRKINCNLVKLYDFAADMGQPYGSMEMKPVSNELSAGETKIFDAWQQRAKKEPVR